MRRKRGSNYHTTYRKVSAKKTVRTVNVKGESEVNGGKCTTEKISPRPRTVTPDGTQILSSPTRVLPHPDALRPAPTGPLTECFRCHLLSHYREDCPSYTCPHCRLSALGHPSSACLRFQCDFCHNWGHRDRFCPHRICSICDTPGHIADDCPIEHLSPSQSSVIFGGS